MANPIKHAANEKGLVTNIDSNNLVPSFAGVDARMHILCGASALLPSFHRTGSRPGASAVCDRLVNFVRSQRVSVVTLSSTSARNVSAAWAARGWTPLHMAAAEGHVEVVNLLVEVASLGVQNKDGGGLSCRVPVDLWPWRFVVGFTWWPPEFKMQIKLHVFCTDKITRFL